MRIISDFLDYYDCIESHGQDDAIIWIRQPKVLLRQLNGTGLIYGLEMQVLAEEWIIRGMW
jgi:hypothetical protein